MIYRSGNDPSQWAVQGVKDSVFFAKPVLSAQVAKALQARIG